MKLWADFHTHTKYSHGSGTIEENVYIALEKGLKAIGISEHGPYNIGIGTKLKDFYSIRDEIEQLKTRYREIDILFGCEANVISLDGELDIPLEMLQELDYVMAGLHPLVWAKTIKDWSKLFLENFLSRKFGILKGKVLKQNTDSLICAINRYDVDIITHPGLRLPIDTERLAEVAKKRKTALEINSGHGFMTVDYVKIAKSCGVKFVIGSDAHIPEDVANFSRGIEIAKKAGLTSNDIINASGGGSEWRKNLSL